MDQQMNNIDESNNVTYTGLQKSLTTKFCVY